MRYKALLFIILSIFMEEVSLNAQLVGKRGDTGCGLFNQETNEWIIPARYDHVRVIRDISDRMEPFAACRINGKYALFTASGKRFTNFEYDDFQSKKNGCLIIVACNDRWGVMDMKGHYLFKQDLSSAYFSSNGTLNYKFQNSSDKLELSAIELAVKYKIKLKNDEKAGIGDLVMLPEPEVVSKETTSTESHSSDPLDSLKSLRKPHPVEGTKYFMVQNLSSLSLSCVSDGHFVAFDGKNGDAYIFDTSGNLTGSLKLLDAKSIRFENGRSIARLFDGSMVIIDATGKIIKSLGNQLASTQFIGGIARNVSKGKIYYIDMNGKEIYPDLLETYTDWDILEGLRFPLFPLSENRRPIKIDYKYGFIDENGTMVIRPQFADVHEFSEGLAAVAIKNGDQRMWGFISQEGNIAIKPIFSQEPEDFHYGYAVVRKQNGEYVYINKEGVVSSESFQFAGSFVNGYAIVRKLNSDKKELSTVIDTNFKEVKKSLFDPRNLSYDFSLGLIYAGGNIYSPDGQLLYEEVYDRLDFNEGLSPVNGKTKGYINLDGEYIIIFQQNEF